MELNEIKSAIEAILFASGEPVPISRLSEVLDIDRETVAKICDQMINEMGLSDGGLQMLRLGEEYQLVTKEKHADHIRSALELKRRTPLSQAALEVLAIISYNQPVTRGFVDQIRGVDCGGVVASLAAKGLIEEKGRLDLPGRPLLYGTTPEFLKTFNLADIDQLPPLPQELSTNMEGEMTLEEVISAQ